MPQEAEEEYKEDYDGVVHAEVGEVYSDARKAVREVRREGDGGEVEHLSPWPACREAGFEADFCSASGDVLEARVASGR